MKLKILYGEAFNSEWQTKSFKDEIAAIEWCRKNHKKIACINDYRTSYNLPSHFEIMDAINGMSN